MTHLYHKKKIQNVFIHSFYIESSFDNPENSPGKQAHQEPVLFSWNTLTSSIYECFLLFKKLLAVPGNVTAFLLKPVFLLSSNKCTNLHYDFYLIFPRNSDIRVWDLTEWAQAFAWMSTLSSNTLNLLSDFSLGAIRALAKTERLVTANPTHTRTLSSLGSINLVHTSKWEPRRLQPIKDSCNRALSISLLPERQLFDTPPVHNTGGRQQEREMDVDKRETHECQTYNGSLRRRIIEMKRERKHWILFLSSLNSLPLLSSFSHHCIPSSLFPCPHESYTDECVCSVLHSSVSLLLCTAWSWSTF